MPGTTLDFTLHADGAAKRLAVEIRHAVIAGWTGRDKAALEKHIVELEELGVPRPASTPIYYRVAAARFTTADAIECTGPDSSGEVEFMVLESGGRRFLGVGSDHTDRTVETYGITVSKQMCDKPVAPELWVLDDVLPHWDSLIIRSFATIDGERVLYQEGPVSAMLPPGEIIAGYGPGLSEGTAMFCGTLAAKGGIRPAARFEFELEDPVLKHTIRHGYDVNILPIAG
ncbi:conserved hypothetical protein; putative alcohol dehydrogenase class III [Xanthobacter versatilis]|uniref:DUF2848 domain-containing protein n=1 Tax=Xanthobacter autotrophicus (strain ATCC BAA-1158 / Py2) TaxID=78245 RepID=A7IBA7_XANP2|nr:conserved hypothetical protein; putative alcohol dehydrogenase class III [Xanthobacter autotrophicus Py2]